MNSHANSLTTKIKNLKPGDAVIILKGEGYFPVIRETMTIVFAVIGASGFCANGTVISAKYNTDLILTGERFETYDVTPEAIRLYGEAVLSEEEAAPKTNAKPDWSVPDPFAPEPE